MAAFLKVSLHHKNKVNELSILIPLLNEEESLQELYNWIIKVMQANNYTMKYFLDDSSSDASWSILSSFAETLMLSEFYEKLWKITGITRWICQSTR
jgi:glycosyltransferase involved in cell wall biosynthesis